MTSSARRKNDEPPAQLPSATARWTGFMIALVTAFLGGLTFWNGASSGGGANGLLEMLLGVALIALGIAVAALCIAPATVRDLFSR